jgi:hypothetical protein
MLKGIVLLGHGCGRMRGDAGQTGRSLIRVARTLGPASARQNPLKLCRMQTEKPGFTRPRNETRPLASRRFAMKTMKFTFWKDGDYYLGFWNEYPDYQTQAFSKDELVGNLKHLLADMESGEVPYIRKVEELVLAE